MDDSGSNQQQGHEHEQHALEFLDINFSDSQPGEDNGSATAHAEESSNASSGNGEQFTMDEVFERELVAILTQTATDSNDASATVASPEETVLPALPGSGPPGQASSSEQVQPYEQYVTGLATVLQAAQAMQAQRAANDGSAFQSPGAGASQEPMQTGQTENMNTTSGSDFSDLLARLSATLEQNLQQSQHSPSHLLPQIRVDGPFQVAQSEVVASPGILSVPAESFSCSPASLHMPHSFGIPGPRPTGQIPYYSGPFGTSPQQSQFHSQFQAPGAGRIISLGSPRSDIDSVSSSKAGKGKGKKKQTAESDRSRKPFACAVCEKSFRRSNDMRRHMRIHTDDRPFSCPHEGCRRRFIQRSALHVHLRVHSGEKPHMCEYPLCGRTFSDSSSLARHRRTHTGKRPYACNWPSCTKTFTRRTAHTKHMRKHDPDWEPDPNLRYSFKPKRTEEEEEEEEDDDDDEEEGEERSVIDPALRAITEILAQTQPDRSPQSMTQAAGRGHSSTNPKGVDGKNENPHLVTAISAEIAAAIAQAQAQIQAEIFNDGVDSDEEEEEESDEESAIGDGLGMIVGGIRSERRAPPPPPPPPESTTISESVSSLSTPAVPTASNGTDANAGVEEDKGNDEDEEDFPVPLRERKSKPSKSKSKTTSTLASVRKTNKRKRR